MGDDALKEVVVSAAVCGELEDDGGGAGAAAAHDDVVGVAAELGLVRLCQGKMGRTGRMGRIYLADVLLHPPQGFSLVLQAVIETGTVRLLDFFAREKAVGSHSVIEGHHYSLMP